jgi:cytoskeleton protein RodZ
MASVGAYLRGLRERQGMSIDELSRATRVLHHYLEALETDRTGSLPAPVFTKGFIRAYCQAVGVEPEEALRLYDRMGVPAPELTKVPVRSVRIAGVPEAPDHQAPQHRQVAHRRVIDEPPDFLPVTPAGVPAQGQPREGRARGTVLISFILLVVLGAAFFAVTSTLQSDREGDGQPSAQVTLPTPPAASDAPSAPSASPAPAPAAESPTPRPPAATELARPSPSVTPGTPTASVTAARPATVPGGQASPSTPATPSAPQASSTPAAPRVAAAPSATAASPPVEASAAGARGFASPYRLIARTTETTWMRVRTEDGRTTEETIPPNEIREWISNGPFVITIGNAGGVSLELNGRPIARLGASGSVITRLVLPSDNQ